MFEWLLALFALLIGELHPKRDPRDTEPADL